MVHSKCYVCVYVCMYLCVQPQTLTEVKKSTYAHPDCKLLILEIKTGISNFET